jgi:hypothetical protein
MDEFDLPEIEFDHSEIEFDHSEDELDHSEIEFDLSEDEFDLPEIEFDLLATEFDLLATEFDLSANSFVLFGINVRPVVDRVEERLDVHVEHPSPLHLPQPRERHGCVSGDLARAMDGEPR